MAVQVREPYVNKAETTSVGGGGDDDGADAAESHGSQLYGMI